MMIFPLDGLKTSTMKHLIKDPTDDLLMTRLGF
jgi:hypothetical protein